MSPSRRKPAGQRPQGTGDAAPLDEGRVMATHGRHAWIESSTGERLIGHPRGKRSDVVVGDRVQWRRSGDEGVIESIEPRRNLLHRQDEWRIKSFAANVDQLLMLVAVDPPFSESQLARALIAAASAGIPSRVVLNKVDLPGAPAARARLSAYAAMGVPLLEVALKADPATSLARLTPWLAGRVTLVLGPSGAGKSTLINRLIPDAGAVVGEISVALNSGRHTTTHSTWYWLDAARSGAVIDSPGFQSFGLHHIAATELAALMPDLAAELGGCRFHNCTHRDEPQCALRAAAEAGRITASRWRIYQELHAELSQPPRY